jgi:bis(5'-adenosyl)-triphosphatase
MDLWISVKSISSNLKKFYNTDRVTIAIQDGSDSGQTIQHVHVHLIPILNNEKKNSLDLEKGVGFDNNNREARSKEEMAKEAKEYREAFFYS